MDALEALHTRNSVALLQDPGPDKQQLQNIFQAGLRASDHCRLKPWRFLLVEEDARKQLGQLMLDTALIDQPDMPTQDREKLLAKPLRAPTIILVVAVLKTECFDKVPEIEQLLSAGGAAQLMLAAAHAQGVGAIWRTGSLVYDKRFTADLGLNDEERLVGLLYMGTAKALKPLKTLPLEDYVEKWDPQRHSD